MASRGRPRRWDQARAIAAVQAWAARTGRAPATRDYVAAQGLPGIGTLWRLGLSVTTIRAAAWCDPAPRWRRRTPHAGQEMLCRIVS